MSDCSPSTQAKVKPATKPSYESSQQTPWEPSNLVPDSKPPIASLRLSLTAEDHGKSSSRRSTRKSALDTENLPPPPSPPPPRELELCKESDSNMTSSFQRRPLETFSSPMSRQSENVAAIDNGSIPGTNPVESSKRTSGNGDVLLEMNPTLVDILQVRNGHCPCDFILEIFFKWAWLDIFYPLAFVAKL